MTTVGDLAVIRFAAVQPRRRDRSFKTAEQVEERGVLGEWEFFSRYSGQVGIAQRMAQSRTLTHKSERQGCSKEGGDKVGRYTSSESGRIVAAVSLVVHLLEFINC